MNVYSERNIAMVMDLYELTMANGYFMEEKNDDLVTFDVFYRHNPDNGGYAIFAGLEQVIEYIENMHFTDEDISYLASLHMFNDEFLEYLRNYHFHGDIFAFPEGTIMYPTEPVLTVVAPLIDAQLVETTILAEINHQSLVATKASRIVRAAKGRAVSDFGARRAHNMDAAVYGARACYIGGCVGTATVMAGQMFNIPVSGTMAHSWVMYQPDEFTAFKKFAELYPDNSILLIDTYDVLNSGLPNAIRTAKEVLEPAGHRLKGVRIDSGDLAYLSRKIRERLDEAGLNDCIIVASNSLDEYTISSILDQGGSINSFGVGERMITSYTSPVFGAVYKLSEVLHNGKRIPKIKVSETVEKITNPGRKRVFRVYDEDHHAVADLITKFDEAVPDVHSSYRYVDSRKPWKNLHFENCTLRELQTQVIRNGQRVNPVRPLSEIRDYVQEQLKNEIWDSEQRFENPHTHYIDMSPDYYEMKMNLLYI